MDAPSPAPRRVDPRPAREEDVRYPAGELELAAALLLPERDAPVPAAVILQGSGDSDRTNGWAAAIADELRAAGLAVLLTDKRGCGASEGDWRTAGFHDLAQDALAGVAYSRSRPEIDPRGVGLVGLSQGGWVAPVAAARASDLAFVIDVSGAAVGFAEQTAVEMRNTARAAGLSEAAVGEVLALHRAAGRYALTGAWEPYATALAVGLDSPWRELAAGFPQERDLPVWTFLRHVGDFDPLPSWMLVEAPVLVLYGAEDERDNVPVAESVRRLEHAFACARKTDVRVRVIEGAGHAFIDPERRELLPEFVEALTSWLTETLESREEPAPPRPGSR